MEGASLASAAGVVESACVLRRALRVGWGRSSRHALSFWWRCVGRSCSEWWGGACWGVCPWDGRGPALGSGGEGESRPLRPGASRRRGPR